MLTELDWLAASPWRKARRRPTGAQSTVELAEDDYRGAPVRVVSAPDCVDATNFVAEFDPAPVNVTHMRVQHIGDAGTS